MASAYIMAIGRIEQGGAIQLDVAMPPWEDWQELVRPIEDEEPPFETQPFDGLLQQAIDEAAELEEYQDYLADQEWHSRGLW